MGNGGRGSSRCYSVFTLLLLLCFFMASTISASILNSDGVDNRTRDTGSYLTSPEGGGGGGGCEELLGFVPCSSTAAGNLFLILIYGYFMFLATSYLSNGSELLLEIMGPGFVSGCFLRLLGSLPDAVIVLVSGLSGSTTIAQDKVAIGMGLVAGSTVVRLTIIWGTYVVVGKCDLEGLQAVNQRDTKGFDLFGSGVSTDRWTNYAAWIMSISLVPLAVVQIPQALSSRSGRHLAVLIATIISAVMLIGYCLYEVFQPRMQERWIEYVKHKRVMTGFLKHLKKHALGRLCNHDGSPNDEVIAMLFKKIDQNGDGNLCKGELKAFVIGIHLEGLKLGEDHIVDSVMREFDIERQDDTIDLDEFRIGISKLLGRVTGDRSSHHNADTFKKIDAYDEEAKMEHALLGDPRDEEGEEVEKSEETVIKAISLVVLGTLIAAVFAEPLIDAFHHFSDATTIPMFFLSFIALPLATTSGEAVSALMYISKKKRKSTSLTFSELFGVVTVNNLLCLTAFLAVVYVRGLAWGFSSEMFIIFLVFVIMGAISSFRTVFPLWTAFVAFLLYPFLLVLAYLLKYVLGWS